MGKPIASALVPGGVVEHLDLMAKTIFGEARGEPLDGQAGVGWVIRNRAEHFGWWGVDIKSVCLKRLQFSCWNENDPNSAVIKAANLDQPMLLQCMGVAALVLSGAALDPTGGATSYFRPGPNGEKPDWADSLKFLTAIGNHMFYGGPR
jgi:spore germination cell wall hydrolase CwlJ-like protein